jgi:hypothetical protein
MNCERIREQLPECLAGALDKAAREHVIEHLEGCSSCRADLADLGTVWRGMDAMNAPEPDRSMRMRFLETLEAYKAGLEQAVPQPINPLAPMTPPRRRAKWLAWWPTQPALQMAFAAALLLGGVLVGRWQAAPRQANPEIAALEAQVEGLRQMVSLSLLQQQSAGDRLRGVSFSEQVAQPDAELEKQLLHMVTHDPNVNVRLSAVDALQKFSAKAEVRRALIDAIPMQESPLVQTALVDLLTQWNDRDAVAALRDLSRNDRTDPIVRRRATLAVEKLETSK